MSYKTINQQITINAPAKILFNAWLDSKKHSEMTGEKAIIEPKTNGKFSAWDGYIQGLTTYINEDNLEILQDWRSDENNWPENIYSKIVIKFIPLSKLSTKIEFKQSNIPDKCFEDIKRGWEDYYWKPMKEYFENN